MNEKNTNERLSSRIVTGWFNGKLIDDDTQMSTLKNLSKSASVTLDVRYLSSMFTTSTESYQPDNCLFEAIAILMQILDGGALL